MQTPTAHPVLTPQLLGQSVSFDAYYAFCEDLMNKGQTTGPDQSPEMLEYSRLNYHRMKRLVNHPPTLLPALAQALQGLRQPQHWVVFSEPWCGDAAQIVPLLAQVAQASQGRIDLGILLRDEHPQAMDHYLTNGGRAIPKLVALCPATGRELFVWGPRPAAGQAIVEAFKANPAGRTKWEMANYLHKWYAQDRTASTQHELAACIAGLAH
jgi:hypothetical protein